MSTSSKLAEVRRIFGGLWKDKDYVHTKKEAHESATKYLPMLTRLATAVDIRCCGGLGTRCVRKQIQALFHFAISNQKMRVNANTLVPSTSALVVSATVGSGKSLYHGLFEEVIVLLRKSTELLDKQIHDYNVVEENNGDGMEESHDLVQMLSGMQGDNSKKQIRFKSRNMLINPGTKEGWEKSLETEKRVIQLISEGDD